MLFEYGVILNGSQTIASEYANDLRFEYGVILNGSQTFATVIALLALFEYGVILNGSQTFILKRMSNTSLSMVLF